MSVLTKVIYRYNAISIKISMAFFQKQKKKKNTPKMCLEPQKTPKSQNPEKEEQNRRYHTS